MPMVSMCKGRRDRPCAILTLPRESPESQRRIPERLAEARPRPPLVPLPSRSNLQGSAHEAVYAPPAFSLRYLPTVCLCVCFFFCRFCCCSVCLFKVCPLAVSISCLSVCQCLPICLAFLLRVCQMSSLSVYTLLLPSPSPASLLATTFQSIRQPTSHLFCLPANHSASHTLCIRALLAPNWALAAAAVGRHVRRAYLPSEEFSALIPALDEVFIFIRGFTRERRPPSPN